MIRSQGVSKWRHIKSPELKDELAKSLAVKLGKPVSEAEKKRADEILLEREQFHVLIVSDSSLESGFLVRTLENQSFSVARVSSLEEAGDLVPEANLILVDKRNNNEADHIREIRRKYDFEKLPITVFSDAKKPDNLPYVDWMPKPNYDEMVSRVVHQWKVWHSVSFIDALWSPLDALLTDMMLNVDKFQASKDPSLEKLIGDQFAVFREHAPFDLRRFGVQIYFAGTKREGEVKIPGLESVRGIATDKVFTLGELTPESQQWCLKFFNSNYRAKLEVHALEELKRRGQSSKKDLGLSGKVNAPDFLESYIFKYLSSKSQEYYLTQEYIKGPMVYSVMPEIIDAAKSDDFASSLLRALRFVKNEQIAHLQENPVSLSGFKTVNTDYVASVIENLSGNLGFFRLKTSESLAECIRVCLEQLYKGLALSRVQYFDFNDTNLMLDIEGNRRSTLADVVAAFKADGLENKFEDVKKFTVKRLRKIDFNKIDRMTSPAEDLSHEFDYHEGLQDDGRFVAHYLLSRKKEVLIRRINDSANREDLSSLAVVKTQLDELESDISVRRIEEILGGIEAYPAFKRELKIVAFYRTMRWFGHALRKYVPAHRNQMKFAKKQMTKLCDGKFDDLIGNSRGYKLESNIAKHVKRVKNRERRHFLCNAVFENDCSDKLTEFLGPRLDDFVSYANMYACSYQDFRHDLKLVKYYLSRAQGILTDIDNLNSSGFVEGVKVPSLSDERAINEYISQIKQAASHEKNQPKFSRADSLSAAFLCAVVKGLYDTKMDYEKLERTGVSE